MKYAYYPGCSAHSTARDMHESAVAVAGALGIDLVEPEGWTCCGATAAHQTDRVLAASLPAANLLKVQEMGLDMLANCAACYNRMKTANHEVSTNQKMRKLVSDAVGKDYDGTVKVRHIIEILLEDIGLENIKSALKGSLRGLQIACYYGCLLVRPHEVTKFDDPENPTSLERLVDALGGISLDWPHKVECCGGGLSLTRTDIVVNLTDSIVGMAKAAGAQCIAVSCPMCQINLDLRQQDIEKQTGTRHDMPVIYVTQLLGLCLGISPGKLGLNKLMVSPASVMEKIEVLAHE
ncbi:MAG: CoB--CoM heterodisulfide reductase iron-sulfur subunit B family protein [Planctomycetota bacterium]|jgi:heterodisulfide reductase subunit B